ncbi:putative DNA repair protein rad9 [Cladophialophora carrionii]|uniref:DNA repair protein rad9 n=1 Tax=Cladophialophora carrionii TaxID=86049 RepID=A0A1C1CRA8_9EURO|nr:putative DNA repair protein rad9 [Cladophialophora carrionii]
MPTLLFTVAPSGVVHLHDFLTCLARFDEDVSLEATPQFNKLRFSSLNISKTAHAAFTLDSSFFTKYHFSPGPRPASGPASQKQWSCKIQNRALLSIFKRRLGDRDREGGLETCDCELQANPDQAECRLVFRLNCRQGIVKTYRLFYEPGEIMHAAFDKLGSTNYWTASSRTLRDVVEYFGPKTDQLDWYFQNGKVTFTSYTEKIQAGRVAVERKDFNDFNVQEGLHIGTMVKDFRSIIAHAETMRTPVTARYSRGNRPMQISYGEGGLAAEFTLMTRGSTNVPSNASNASTTTTPARDLSMRPASRNSEKPAATSRSMQTNPRPAVGVARDMPPPPRTSPRDRESMAQPPLAKSDSLNSAVPPSASIDPNSLFIPADEDDQQWDEPNFEQEPDIVTWDNTADNALSAPSSTRLIRDSEMHSFASVQEQALQQPGRESRPTRSRFPAEIAPTQRLSQFKGIFD